MTIDTHSRRDPLSGAADVNVGRRLSAMAAQRPEQIGVAMPRRRKAKGKRSYDTVTFVGLERDSNRIAAGLQALGVEPGTRLVLMVRPSIDFIALVFALLKAGVVIVLIDPGMGRRNLIRCLEEVRPEGFVAIPVVHAVRSLLRGRFSQARFNVTVGRRWFWGGYTLEHVRARGSDHFEGVATTSNDPAAIIFTTGSTGPPKGVLYSHGNFDQQVEQIQQQYDIQPGEIDLPGFPLFGLFNAAMGVTTVVPDMDPTHPAKVDPENIIEAITDWNVTQAFGSPALWNVVGRYCEQRDVRLPTLRRLLSAGAPVPPHVLKRMTRAMADDGQMHTPYGATEALPVATISAREVLGETAARSDEGAGTCVGRRFSGIQWRVIRITDEPIERIEQCEELPPAEIGELIVRGPVVTRQYISRPEANALHKIADGESFWHRMGDVGYLDEQDRFWFCGRKSHRVTTPAGPMFTVPCEAILNRHPVVYRSALVGVGPAGRQAPVMVAELEREARDTASPSQLRKELLDLAHSHPATRRVSNVLLHPSLPVDIRHNSKIFREQLAQWVEGKLRNKRSGEPRTC